ncbi:MAG: hypothetical protein ACRCVE_12995, partial [Plesiomonas sp.]
TTCVHVLSLCNIQRRLSVSIVIATRLIHCCCISSSLLAICTALVFIRVYPDTFSLFITTLLTLGAVFTHLLMVAARCRLQAFHRLLPLVGFIGILSVCGSVVYQTLHMSVDVVLSTLIMVFITVRLILLASGFLLWVWPLIMYHQYAYADDQKMKAKSIPSRERLAWVFCLYLGGTLLAILTQ